MEIWKPYMKSPNVYFENKCVSQTKPICINLWFFHIAAYQSLVIVKQQAAWGTGKIAMIPHATHLGASAF